jgi:CheY-like chemotaxis protein
MIERSDVLVIDDNDDLRAALTILLQCEGHHVIEAADGQRALDAMASSPSLDVIVLDLRMPVMDGTTFLQHKAQGAHADVPVVIFSSSPPVGLERFADVSSVVPKLDGIEGLLAAIRHAEGAALPWCAPAGGLHR